jgi:hypothetical protein
VSGREVFSLLNKYLQDRYNITLSGSAVIAGMTPGDIPHDLKDLLAQLDEFRLVQIATQD